VVPQAGVQAHLITPDMTATPGTEAPRAGVATAATARPAIVSRKGWGAVESLRRAGPDYSSTVKAAVIHHTVKTNRYAPSESAALVRADYLYHVRSRGWNDIGYNFLVDRYGRVFEGRYGGITRAVLGAHAGGFNTYTTGVAMLGTFSSSRPPAAMLASLKRLLAWKLDLSHVDPAGKTTLRSAGGANVRYPAGRKIFSSAQRGVGHLVVEDRFDIDPRGAGHQPDHVPPEPVRHTGPVTAQRMNLGRGGSSGSTACQTTSTTSWSSARMMTVTSTWSSLLGRTRYQTGPTRRPVDGPAPGGVTRRRRRRSRRGTRGPGRRRRGP
jgi:N-acetylmuramoyl-L-alanine amidase